MSPVPAPLVIGLGGNVGDDAAIQARFASARAAIARWCGGPARSAALYRTAPIGPAQPAFLNTAIAVDAGAATPAAVVAALQAIEAAHGRDRAREQRWGPRSLDLDVLIWGTRALATPALTVPHPRLGDRRFALAPLAELVGDDFVVPGVGRVGARLAAVAAQGCARVADAW